MNNPRENQGARSRAEWSKIVAEFVRSGDSAEVFASRRELNAGTLRWWRTRLQPTRGRAVRAITTAPRLVPVTIVRSRKKTATVCPAKSWEVRGAAGDVLRVEGELPIESLREVLAALTRAGRHR